MLKRNFIHMSIRDCEPGSGQDFDLSNDLAITDLLKEKLQQVVSEKFGGE